MAQTPWTATGNNWTTWYRMAKVATIFNLHFSAFIITLAAMQRMSKFLKLISLKRIFAHSDTNNTCKWNINWGHKEMHVSMWHHSLSNESSQNTYYVIISFSKLFLFTVLKCAISNVYNIPIVFSNKFTPTLCPIRAT